MPRTRFLGGFPFRTTMAPFVVAPLTKHSTLFTVTSAMRIFWKLRGIGITVQAGDIVASCQMNLQGYFNEDGTVTSIPDEEHIAAAQRGLYFSGEDATEGVGVLSAQLRYCATFSRGGASSAAQMKHADSLVNWESTFVAPMICCTWQFDGTGGAGFSMESVSQTEDGPAPGVESTGTTDFLGLTFRGDHAGETLTISESAGSLPHWTHGGTWNSLGAQLLDPHRD